MASVVGICNVALRRINAQTITALTEGSKNANACNDLYANARDVLLRTHVWNFAVSRAALSPLAAAPAFGFSRAFQLPADFIRVVGVASGASYRLEGNSLLSDEEAVDLRYVRREEDPNVMSADFRDVLSLRLAADLATAIANSRTLRESMMREYEQELLAAKSADALEDHPEEEPASSWLDARN
jgi:hypothetical protein